jgi:P27 family predicted phage terminase small subunit
MPTPRKSLEQHDLENTTPQYVAHGESHVPGSLPKPAKFLSKDAKKKFRALVRQLASRRTVTEGDADLISIECSLWEQWQQSLLKIREEGSIRIYTRLGADGVSVEVEKENLHVKIAQNCQRQMVTILRQLGLTPSARDTVRPVAAPKKTVEEEDQGERDKMLLQELLAERAAQKVPEEPPLSLDDIDETVVGNDVTAPTISPETQALLDEADAFIAEEKNEK